MTLLGLSICHDSHATIVRDGKLIAAVGEERLNRVKMYYGFPFLAIQSVLDIVGLEGNEIDLENPHFLAAATPELHARLLEVVRLDGR